jgi:hypothetical protein
MKSPEQNVWGARATLALQRTRGSSETIRPSAVSVSGLASNYEVRYATSLGKSIYLVDVAPVFFICRCARDTGEAGEKLTESAVAFSTTLPRLVAM